MLTQTPNTLTPTQQERLARIARRATLHEAELTNRATGQRLLFCYTRRTRRGLVDYLRTGSTAVQLATFTQAEEFSPKLPGDDITLGDWGIRFSGRTQREAIMGGELPFWKRA